MSTPLHIGGPYSKNTYSYHGCRCTRCINATAKYFREYRKRKHQADPNFYKKRALRERYNLTLDERKAMGVKQKQRCAICNRKVKLVVDHNHNTGKVRGLLCNSCNRALGIFPTIERLKSAMKYLQ